MNRTQIYLPRIQAEALRALARERKATMSEVIREILREKLRNGPTPLRRKSRETLLQAAKRINALGEKGPRDLASNLDQYLYGGK